MRTVASDFDNTLFVKEEQQFLNNIEAIRNFIDRGNTFIIITGRSFSNIKQEINKYNIPYKYLVCQDGANIFDDKDNCLKSNLLDKNKSERIEEYLKNNNLEYSFESAYNDNDTIDNAVKITVTLKETDNPYNILEKIKNVENIYSYVSTKHINIIDYNVNKSNALTYLINNNYIDNNVTVIGDDINDYEMLEKFHGVIMKKHDSILDDLNKEEIDSLQSYLDRIQ